MVKKSRPLADQEHQKRMLNVSACNTILCCVLASSIARSSMKSQKLYTHFENNNPKWRGGIELHLTIPSSGSLRNALNTLFLNSWIGREQPPFPISIDLQEVLTLHPFRFIFLGGYKKHCLHRKVWGLDHLREQISATIINTTVTRDMILNARRTKFTTDNM